MKTELFKIEQGKIKVPMTCSQCGDVEYIDRDTAERYYEFEDNDYLCTHCNNDLMEAFKL